MNTIQVSEESAIIPLSKLNEYKQTELNLKMVLNDRKNYKTYRFRTSMGYEGEIHAILESSFEYELRGMERMYKDDLERITERKKNTETSTVEGLYGSKLDYQELYEDEKARWTFFDHWGVWLMIIIAVEFLSRLFF